MAFIHNCKECPMKFQSETDLQTHLIVHSVPTDHGLDDKTQPVMAEFLRSFFPNLLNPSDIPPLKHPNSIPSFRVDDATDEGLLDEGYKTYTALSNMHVPGMADLIKILPQPKKKIRYLNPVRFARAPVIQPVYIERPRRSVALIQNTYGDDRSSRAVSNVVRPEVVMARVAPTITRVQRLDPSGPQKKIEELRNQIPVRTPTELCPPPTKTQEPNPSAPQDTPRVPDDNPDTFPNAKLYTCLLCLRRFSFAFQLNRHLMMTHSSGGSPQEGHRRLGCNGGKRGRGVYSCTVCKRTFGRINYLNLHKRCHKRKENGEPMDEVSEHGQI